MTLVYYGIFLIKYHNHLLIPFAIANNETGFFNDGYVVLACFDGTDKRGNSKVYYYDSGNSILVDWAKKYYLNNFLSWLKLTKKESKQYKIDML
ncbi:hypothetical protein [Snodgrassella gandavensis]|uniref:hypothetical protein n=1 Tax=Snodgrassella gandavensis TaxID=2946698 RepID=UPI001EF41C6E|nr:hypothetical protein [Snodgrassella gandavensis]